MVKNIEINRRNINRFKNIICYGCNLEIHLKIGLILFYTISNSYMFKHYYHEKCISIKKEKIEKHKTHSGLDENTINQLEEQSNINFLLMYKNDKELKTGYNRVKLRRLGYLTKSGEMTDKALIILNKEKI